MSIRHIQYRLKKAGFYKDVVDGVAGKNTWNAVDAVLDKYLPEPDMPLPSIGTSKITYPRQRNMRSFYGRAGGPQCTRGKVILEVPMVIAWDQGKKINRFSCHEKLAGAFTSIIKNTISHYGENEWRRLGLNLYGGCYNFRKMRGGSSLSTHAYGAALDLDPANNRLRWGRDKARFAQPEYDPFWKIVEAHGFVSLGRVANRDFMHIQAAQL